MAEAPAFPESFKDPVYASLDAANEQQLGLPPGLLASVRLNGEKSNASQVSSAGAKTPYQITGATREAAIDKFGIDPYLSAQNASEVAARLLADSMKRNQGNPVRAVAEYHGGTDPSNWGPLTSAYVQRVMKGVSAPSAAPDINVAGMTGQSTFDRAAAQAQLQQAPNQLAALYTAYSGGQMSPEEQQQYESDVRSGRMMLPRGAALKSGQPGAGGAVAAAPAQEVPEGVMQAFTSGKMTPQEMADFERDVRAGAMHLPGGADPNTLFGAPHAPKSVLERIAGIPGQLREAITGEQRHTATTDALPDWATMPELNTISMAGLKTGLGTILSDPAESAQIIKANFPGVQVAQDEKGNYLLTSSIDGKQYAIKPGFQVSDIPRAGAAIAAFSPAGRATSITGAALRSGATQAVVEGTQAGTGGNFDVSQVAAATGLGAAVPAVGRVLATAAAPAKAAIARAMGRAPAAAEAPVQEAAAAAAPMPAAAPSVQDVAQAAQKAAAGGVGAKGATEDLAAMAAPNAKTAEAAQRLGIEGYLQPDHVTSSDAYRQVVGAIKSVPTSQLAISEREGLASVAQRAAGLIDEVGGTSDLSQLNAGLKSRMQAAHAGASAQEDALWQKLRDTIPAKSDAPAPNALAFAKQRADELGGVQNLTPMERAIVSKLTPKGGDSEVLSALSPAARQQAIDQGAQAAKQPTYALLDDVRKDVGAVLKNRGPFTDADTGLAKKYYALLSDDQEGVAKAAGAADLVRAAKAATTVRKGMEDDLTALFGKNLDASIVPNLGGAMKAASTGDATKLVKMLSSVPDDMRQEMVASGLQTVFRNAATRGQISFTGYAKWYEGLLRNKQAYHAVMANLPMAARKQLSDLYRVSKGISDSLSARTVTGLHASVIKSLEAAPDTLAGRLYELALHAGKGLGKAIAVDAVGGHGSGLAMGLYSAVKGAGKTNTVKAVDELITSPEFERLARAGGTRQQAESVRAFAYSKPFTRFVRSIGNPRELNNRERWVMGALQTNNDLGGSDVRH